MDREILLPQFATAEPRWQTVEFRRKAVTCRALNSSHGLDIIYIYISGWWFGTFYIVPYIGNNNPN